MSNEKEVDKTKDQKVKEPPSDVNMVIQNPLIPPKKNDNIETLDAPKPEQVIKDENMQAKDGENVTNEPEESLAKTTPEIKTRPRSSGVAPEIPDFQFSISEEQVKSIKNIFQGYEVKRENDSKNMILMETSPKGKPQIFMVSSEKIEAKGPVDEAGCEKMLKAAQTLYGNNLIIKPANDEEKKHFEKIAKNIPELKINFAKDDKELKELQEKYAQESAKATQAKETAKTEKQVEMQVKHNSPSPAPSQKHSEPELSNEDAKEKRVEKVANSLRFTDKSQDTLREVLNGNYSDLFDVNGNTVTFKTDMPQTHSALLRKAFGDAVEQQSGTRPEVKYNEDPKQAMPITLSQQQLEAIKSDNKQGQQLSNTNKA